MPTGRSDQPRINEPLLRHHSIATHCPKSGDLLIDRCPRCGGALLWTRIHLEGCHRCGLDMRTHEPARVTARQQRETRTMLDVIHPDPARHAFATAKLFAVATAIVATGLFLVIRDYRRENRQKVIVIEARGLRDWQGEPLEKAVPPSVPGRRDAVIVDVRQGLIDGQIVAPERALQKLANLPDDIARRTSGTDRSDVSFVLGGLAPVPFLFLLGVIVDDEHRTTIMDWDRKRHIWRPLDDENDGKGFDVTGLNGIAGGPTRVCLCVSASYDVLEADVRLVEPTAPIVRLDLPDRSTASHWSEEKQQRLAQQFLDTVMALAAKGVGEIALFLAAPASLALRFGTVYDRRNLPQLAVNQFENSDSKKFPWMVWMPVAGAAEARLELR